MLAARCSLLATSRNKHPGVGGFVAGGGDVEPWVEPADFVERRGLRGGDDRGCGRKGLGEERLRGVLAEAQNLHRGGEERGDRCIAEAGEHGIEWSAEHAAF